MSDINSVISSSPISKNTKKEDTSQCSEVEQYRCPYCFKSVPNNEKSIQEHLLFEYTTRGINEQLIQFYLKQASDSSKLRDNSKEADTNNFNRTSVITNKDHSKLQDYKHLVAWQETWKTSLHANPQIFYNNFSQHYPIQDLYSNTAAILNDPQQVAHLKSTQPLHTHNQNRLVQGNPTHYFNNSGGTFNLNPVSQLGVSPVLSANLGSAIEAVNWCAHCSISFRLTSDLVQHMRNFHACGNSTANEKPNSSSMAGKISSDSVKTSAFKNVIKNFKCSSCGESFKERHHLTRHLSSHTTPISRLASNARYSLAASKNKLQVEQQETSDYKRAKITN